jgi:hypothetical protein
MKKRLKKTLLGLLALAIIGPVGGYFYLFGRPHPADPQMAEVSFDALLQYADMYAGDSVITLDHQAYLDTPGSSVGVWKYQFDLNAEQMAVHQAENSRLYEELNQRFKAVAATESAIRASYAELEEQYPDAVFSPLHVFFGGYSIRSLIKPHGMFMAGEYFSGMPAGMDPHDPNYLRGLVSEPQMLVSQTMHEQAHIQQARSNPLAMFTSTVLERAIYEGTADLVSELITGEHNNPTAMAYVSQHGEALWCQFYRSNEESYRTRWIDANAFGRPPASIYGAFGLPIARAYFNTFEDPQKGLHALLELSDSYIEIFEHSGMQQQLARQCSESG